MKVFAHVFAQTPNSIVVFFGGSSSPKLSWRELSKISNSPRVGGILCKAHRSLVLADARNAANRANSAHATGRQRAADNQ